MARKVFYSFHYANDNWRASTVRNIGKLERANELTDNDWETLKKNGDHHVQNWIDSQLKGRSCTVVLIGEQTHSRKWIKYEIERSRELGKGMIGIHIHNIQDNNNNQAIKGRNPFEQFKENGTQLSDIIDVYDPPYQSSKYVYDYIANNINTWVENSLK